MLGRLRCLWLSLILASSALAVAFVSPVAAVNESCPVTSWTGPSIFEERGSTYLWDQLTVNCPSSGRGEKLQLEIWRGGFTGIRVANQVVDCVQGVCNYHAITAVVQKTCDSTASRWYAQRYRTMIDDKFGWNNWTQGAVRTINCLVIPQV
jgi:hypothetical protein